MSEIDTKNMPSALNILCAICNEFYGVNDEITSTYCGHLFHHRCLRRWLNRSATCPECRVSCHDRRVHRVFLNYGERTADDAEIEAVVKDPHWEYLDMPNTPDVAVTLPADAIKAGVDSEGNDVYVARVPFGEDLLPANFSPTLGGVHTSWGCTAHFRRHDIEILVGSKYKWQSAANGQVPENAIPTGYADTGETLYTARAQYEGILLPGKVHPSHHVLYMPYNGREVNIKEYEVLVEVPTQQET